MINWKSISLVISLLFHVRFVHYYHMVFVVEITFKTKYPEDIYTFIAVKEVIKNGNRNLFTIEME